MLRIVRRAGKVLLTKTRIVSSVELSGCKLHSRHYPTTVNTNSNALKLPVNRSEWQSTVMSQLVYRALQLHSLRLLKRLLATGYPMAKYKHGYTPLMVAVDNEDFEAVTQLLYAGAPVNEQDDIGETALMRAARRDNWDIVHALLEVSLVLY